MIHLKDMLKWDHTVRVLLLQLEAGLVLVEAVKGGLLHLLDEVLLLDRLALDLAGKELSELQVDILADSVDHILVEMVLFGKYPYNF